MIFIKKSKLMKELSNYRSRKDFKENKETKIPENEKVNFRCLWVFEIYTPNYINNLIDGIDKIEWESPDIEEELPLIIKKIREGNSYNWYNLGRIDTLKSESCKLPKHVDFAFGGIFQYMPSISILSVQFVFNDEISKLFKNTLNTEYETVIEIIKKGYRFHSPFHQKIDAVKKLRENIYESCYEWYRRYIPGLYSDKLTKVNFPTCEFMTLEDGTPFHENNNKYNDYMNILEISKSYNSWMSNELKGIRVEFPSLKNDSDFTSIKIAGNSKEIKSDKNYKSYNELEKHSIEYYLMNFDHNLISWVIYVLMRTSRCILSEIRDSISSINLGTIKKSMIEIEKIRRNFLSVDRNISYFVNELKPIKKNIFLHDNYKFIPNHLHSSNKDKELFENLFDISIRETENMGKEYKNIRNDIETTTNVISSITNQKFAKSNKIIGIIMIVLTFVIIIISFKEEFIGIINYLISIT